MRTPGTVAFLLRWHFIPFVGGLAMAIFAGYQLCIYEPLRMPAVFGSPVEDFFVPVMLVTLFVGLVLAIRAYRKAWAAAGGELP